MKTLNVFITHYFNDFYIASNTSSRENHQIKRQRTISVSGGAEKEVSLILFTLLFL